MFKHHSKPLSALKGQKGNKLNYCIKSFIQTLYELLIPSPQNSCQQKMVGISECGERL